MKVIKLTNLIAVAMALAMVSSGCKHKPVGMTHIPNAPQTGPKDFNTGPIADNGMGNGLNNGVNSQNQGGIAQPPPGHVGWKRDETAMSINTVHFDYDSSVVKSSEKSKIAAVAEYLKGNASAAVEVDGHCDERGTDEYNRALGERRALAIREDLVGLGIEASRVDTVTFGRDKPVDLGHTEAAHAKNRRGEFILLTPP